jgi:hypothetical protein
MLTYCKPYYDDPAVFFVETWYDRVTRNWVTQLKTANLEQIGNAVYSGSKLEAFKVHAQFIDGLTDGMPYLTETFRR